MKKLITITFAAACLLFVTTASFISVSAQSAQQAAGVSVKIPDGVMRIAEKSCINCHKEPGNSMALAHVNFTKWESYSPEKQASKAQAMCNMVTKSKMPPKGFRKDHPDAVPSTEDIKVICDWAQSVAPPKK